MLLVLWLMSRSGKAVERSRTPDVLDEGAAPAQRNQALIDAAPATQVPRWPCRMRRWPWRALTRIACLLPKQMRHQARSPMSPPAVSAGEIGGDDLTRIKGLGPKLLTLLAGLGITRYAQIAAWSETDVDRIDPQLGAIPGPHPPRQLRRAGASFLRTGDVAGFEGKFGRV